MSYNNDVMGAALDRHITGNYGDDQFGDEPPCADFCLITENCDYEKCVIMQHYANATGHDNESQNHGEWQNWIEGIVCGYREDDKMSKTEAWRRALKEHCADFLKQEWVEDIDGVHVDEVTKLWQKINKFVPHSDGKVKIWVTRTMSKPYPTRVPGVINWAKTEKKVSITSLPAQEKALRDAAQAATKPGEVLVFVDEIAKVDPEVWLQLAIAIMGEYKGTVKVMNHMEQFRSNDPAEILADVWYQDFAQRVRIALYQIQMQQALRNIPGADPIVMMRHIIASFTKIIDEEDYCTEVRAETILKRRSINSCYVTYLRNRMVYDR